MEFSKNPNSQPGKNRPTPSARQTRERASEEKCLAIPSVRSSILAACIHIVSLLAPTLDRRAIRPFAAAFPLHSPVSFLRIVSFPCTWQRCLVPTGVWEESHNLICLGRTDIAGSVRGCLCLQSHRDCAPMIRLPPTHHRQALYTMTPNIVHL
ncbi:hypothetical protein V8C44DRAFT_253759 [Trichoderma aethiopicum]